MQNISRFAYIKFFFPEMLLIAFVFFASEQLTMFMLDGGKIFFGQCQSCVESKPFLASAFLFSFCLISHCIRFLIFHWSGNRVLAQHIPSLVEFLISLLIVSGYAVFLQGALASPQSIATDIAIGMMDILGASFSALSVIVIIAAIVSVISNQLIKGK